MAGFKQHGEHLAPQVGGEHLTRRFDLATSGTGFVDHIGFFEVGTKQVVQIGHVVGREQGPLAFFHHALHEQVGDPVGRVHVVGAAAVIAGVLAQLQEFFDVQVPSFQVSADRAFALAALVDRHGRVVDHFEEGHHALGLAVGAFDVGAQSAHAGPVVAQAAGEFGQQGVFFDGLVNAIQVVGHGGQVAARELAAQGAAVEQRGGRGHEVKAREHFVELDGAGFAVDFAQRQAHGHAHEEDLGQFDAGLAHVQEVAVVQGLQTDEVNLQVALWLEGCGQAGQVELQQLLVEQLVFNAFFDALWEEVGVTGAHLFESHFFAQDFLDHGVQQQTRGGVGVVGVFFDVGASGQDGGFVDLFDRHAVVEVAHGFADDGLGFHIGAQASASAVDQLLQTREVQRFALTALGDLKGWSGRRCGGRLLGALLGAALAVEHIGARHFVVAAAHQAEFDLVLHVFDVEGATAGARTHQRTHHVLRQGIDVFAHAGRCCSLGAVDGQEGFHQRHGDLAGFKRHHGAVAANDLVLRKSGVVAQDQGLTLEAQARAHGAGGGGRGGGLHGFSSGVCSGRPGGLRVVRAHVGVGLDFEKARTNCQVFGGAKNRSNTISGVWGGF